MERTLKELHLKQINKFNHPESGSECKFCNGVRNWYTDAHGNKIYVGQMIMVLAPGQSERYYHGLIVPCPACNYDTEQQYIDAWWDELYLETQQEYNMAAEERRKP